MADSGGVLEEMNTYDSDGILVWKYYPTILIHGIGWCVLKQFISIVTPKKKRKKDEYLDICLVFF